MNPQDRTAVRTALDIERKYNLKGITKAVEMQKDNLYKLDVNLNNFVNVITKDLDDLQDQVDGNITTWFYNGEPTLETYPTTEWKHEEYNIHLGDLYYDSDTGYSYRFALNNDVYEWKKLTDSDVTKALAMANSAKDTADSKRRIFIETPIVPYDNGDMWIKDEEIYICQISKDINQTFNENDFIIATKYTDNTLANQVNDRVTVVAGQVTTIEQNVDKITAEMEDAKYYIDEEGNKILISEQINKITATAHGLNQTITSAGGNNIIRNSHLNYPSEEKITKKETGNPVKIEKAKQIDTLRLNGYTKQKTYSGKNLLNVTSTSKTFSNGFTITVNPDKSITLNGEYADSDTGWYRLANDFTLPAGTYTLTNGNTNASYATAIFMDDAHNFNASNNIDTKTFNSEKTIEPYIRITNNTSYNNFTIYPMIVEGTDAGDYEPYVGGIPSPNPDYPQEIEIGKGKNMLNPNGVTTTNHGITLTNNGDGTFTASGIATRDLSIDLTTGSQNMFRLEKDVTYTNSIEILSGNMTGQIAVMVYNQDKTSTQYNYVNLSPTQFENSVTPVETKILRAYQYYVKEGTEADFTFRVQFEKGSVATEYEPYNTVVVKSTGKNLLNLNKKPILTAYANSDYDEPNIDIIKTSANLNAFCLFEIGNAVDLNGKTLKYTGELTSGTGRAIIGYADVDGLNRIVIAGNVDISSGVFERSITVDGNSYPTKKVVVWLYSETGSAGSSGDKAIYKNVMVSEDNGTYEPYKESSIQYHLGDNFLADKDYIENGVLNKNIVKTIFDGSDDETWNEKISRDSELTKYFEILVPNATTKYGASIIPNVKCNYFNCNKSMWTIQNNQGISIQSNNNVLMLRINKSIVSTSDEFRNWLSEHNLEVYYEMRNPYTEELETTGELKTFEPTTIISNSLDSNMEVEFTKNGSGYEFWDGDVDRGSNDKSSSFSSLLLQKGNLSQEQDVPNGNYSVSFFYQKLNTLANASVVINDKEYPLDSSEVKQFFTGEQDSETGEYITQPIVVTSNHIKIEFKCDVNDGVEVWDLMCNKGTVKLAWSQNQNETTTETVNISKGITITSTNIEAIFKANANGIKILTLQGATVAYFTDKGLSTKELIVENKAQICGTLVQEVGGQTWFTRM